MYQTTGVGGMNVGLNDLNMTVGLSNSQELIQLLQKAENLLEQLESTIEEINQIKLKIAVEL